MATITIPSSLSAITFSSTTTSTTLGSIVTAPPLSVPADSSVSVPISTSTSLSGTPACSLGSAIGLGGGICVPVGPTSTTTGLAEGSTSTSIVIFTPTPTSLISFSILTATLPIPSSNLPDTTLCSVSFTAGLRYDFVASNQEAQNDIHYYLPLAIAHGLNITDSSQIVMEVLSPYNTSTLEYIKTVAIFWLPTKFVEPLSAQIFQSESYFHTGSSDSNLQLFIELIDQEFPLTGVIFSSEASAEPPLLTAPVTALSKPFITSPATITNSTIANSTTTKSMTTFSTITNSSQATTPAPSPSNSDLSTGAKAGIGIGASLGFMILLTLIASLILRDRKKARPNESKPRQELERHGDPRSELGGNIQLVEKDGVMRNELSADARIWELPSGRAGYF